MEEKVICEVCGSLMEYFIEGHSQGWKCKKCDNEFVTTYIEPIDLDVTEYEISILKAEKAKENFKIISKITGENYLKVKQILESCGLIYKGQARKIKEITETLDKANIGYKISPQFIYK